MSQKYPNMKTQNQGLALIWTSPWIELNCTLDDLELDGSASGGWEGKRWHKTVQERNRERENEGKNYMCRLWDGGVRKRMDT